MSGETQKDESAWTTDSLKEQTERDVAWLEKFVLQQLQDIKNDCNRRFEAQAADNDKRFAAQEKAVATAFDAAKEAVVKSENSVEKRSDAIYVTIVKLQDSLASVMPRAEAEQRFTSTTEKLTEITDRLNKFEGIEKGSGITTSKLYAAIGAVGAVLGIIIVIANTLL